MKECYKMKITQFKKLLSQYGADVGRWPDVNATDVQAFIEKSAQAQKLLEQERLLDNALDSYAVGPVAPALLDGVMARIGGQEYAADVVSTAAASVHKLAPQSPPRKKQTSGLARPVFWGGAVAIAASVFLFISVFGTASVSNRQALQNIVAQNEAVQVPQNIVTVAADSTLASMVMDSDVTSAVDVLVDEILVEEIAQQEMIALWELADASDSIQSDIEIDQFLDDLFDAPANRPAVNLDDDPALQQEMDLWELFLAVENETQEL